VPIASTVRRPSEAVARALAPLGEGIDVTDYVRSLEREFAIAFTVSEVASVHTLGDMAALIGHRLAEAGRPSRADAIWPVVRRITAYEMGIAEAELHEGIRFVEDLCC